LKFTLESVFTVIFHEKNRQSLVRLKIMAIFVSLTRFSKAIQVESTTITYHFLFSYAILFCVAFFVFMCQDRLVSRFSAYMKCVTNNSQFIFQRNSVLASINESRRIQSPTDSSAKEDFFCFHKFIFIKFVLIVFVLCSLLWTFC
jgi:hypothetical protein